MNRLLDSICIAAFIAVFLLLAGIVGGVEVEEVREASHVLRQLP